MQVKKVEKVNVRDVNYKDKKTGKPKTFKDYSFVSAGSWFTLKGKGKEDVKQGDEIWGDVTTETYVHNGEEKTKLIFTIYEPIIVNILKRLQSHEERLKKLENKASVNEVPKAVKEHNSEDATNSLTNKHYPYNEPGDLPF